MSLIIGAILSFVFFTMGGLVTWFVQWIYHIKAEKSANVSTRIIVAGLAALDERIANIMKEYSIQNIDFDISDFVINDIKAVEETTKEVIEAYKKNEKYIPEMLQYQKTLVESAKKIELLLLKYWAAMDYGEDRRDVEDFIMRRAAEARQRLRDMGEDIPPNPYEIR